jgi:hypothetical protein
MSPQDVYLAAFDLKFDVENISNASNVNKNEQE